MAINWDLHVDSDDPQGFILWEKHWNSWQVKMTLETSMESLKLNPREYMFKIVLAGQGLMGKGVEKETRIYRQLKLIQDIHPSLRNKYPVLCKLTIHPTACSRLSTNKK